MYVRFLALTKKSLTFTFNGQEPWQKFKTFLLKHIWYIVGIPTKTNFEHFISLLLIIGGLFWAMAQMKTCNFLDPIQNTLLKFKSKSFGQIGNKSDIASLTTWLWCIILQIIYHIGATSWSSFCFYRVLLSNIDVTSQKLALILHYLRPITTVIHIRKPQFAQQWRLIHTVKGSGHYW